MPAFPHSVVEKLLEDVAAARQQLLDDEVRMTHLARLVDDARQAAARQREVIAALSGRLETVLAVMSQVPAAEGRDDSSAEIPLVSAPSTAVDEVEPPEPPLVEAPSPPPPPPPSADEVVRRLISSHPRLKQHSDLVAELKVLFKNAQIYAAPHAKTLENAREKLLDIGNKVARQLNLGEPADDVFEQYGPDAMNVLRDLRDVLYKIRQYPAHGTTAPSVSAFREPFARLYDRLWDYIRQCCPGAYEEFTFAAGKTIHSQKPNGVQEKAWDIVRTESRPGFAPNEVIETLSPGYVRHTPGGGKELICPARVIVSASVT